MESVSFFIYLFTKLIWIKRAFESLSKGVFERRMSSVRGIFALFVLDFEQILGQIVSVRIKALSNKIW